MRTVLIEALQDHANGQIKKHKANIEIYLKNPTGIGEHSDIVGSIENELNQIAKYEDQLYIIKKYFTI
tara:strand:+ start:3633 stop:3836 length:204 start_codon:yes stop_codon:yes gene_type:complete